MKVQSLPAVKEQGAAFNNAVGKKLSETESDAGAVGAERLRSLPRCLADFTGITFFSLGPVYERLGIDFDILAEFNMLTKAAFSAITLEFKRPVIAGLTQWGRVLQGIPDEIFPLFRRHMDTQGAHFGAERVYSEIVGVDLLVEDPLERDEAIIVTGRKTVITVFVPSTALYSLLPAPASGGLLPVTLYRQPPSAAVALRGKATGNEPITEADLTAYAQLGKLPPELR